MFPSWSSLKVAKDAPILQEKNVTRYGQLESPVTAEYSKSFIFEKYDQQRTVPDRHTHSKQADRQKNQPTLHTEQIYNAAIKAIKAITCY